jgi:hypothetical protein
VLPIRSAVPQGPYAQLVPEGVETELDQLLLGLTGDLRRVLVVVPVVSDLVPGIDHATHDLGEGVDRVPGANTEVMTP